MFCSIEDELKSYDNVFYMDVDMIVERAIDEAILADDFVAVIHPGYVGNEKAATFEVDISSEAFVPEQLRKLYVQGCFFGGKSLPFRYLARSLRDHVERDLGAGEVAVWHDESHLNWFFAHHPFNALSPSYAHPEGWKYETAPIIVHRKKEHDRVRGLSLQGPSASLLLSAEGHQRADATFRALYLKSHEKSQRLESSVARGIALRDELHAERDGLRNERDELHAERDGLRNERDELHAERDGLRNERDGLLTERNGLISERDALRNLIDTWRRRLRWPLWVRRRLRELLSRRVS
jgi:FtsZ-binding cell division protein ZapB